MGQAFFSIENFRSKLATVNTLARAYLVV
jgi:hypothetical protein